MITNFFWYSILFGILFGAFLGGFNWKNLKGSDRDQTVVRNRMIVFALILGALFGLIAFFVH